MKNAFENVVWKMATILSLSECLKACQYFNKKQDLVTGDPAAAVAMYASG